MNKRTLGNCFFVSAVVALVIAFFGTDMYAGGAFEALENGEESVATLKELVGFEKIKAIAKDPGIFSYIFFYCFAGCLSSSLIVTILNGKNI